MSRAWGAGQGDLYPPSEGYIPRVDVREDPVDPATEAFFKRQTTDGQPLSEKGVIVKASGLIEIMMSEPNFLAALQEHRNIKKGEQ